MSPGKVIGKLQAAALNHIAFGHGLESPDGHFNATILGADGAGIVIQVATGVKGLSTVIMFVYIRLPVAVNASFVSPAGTLCASCKEFGGGIGWHLCR